MPIHRETPESANSGRNLGEALEDALGPTGTSILGAYGQIWSASVSRYFPQNLTPKGISGSGLPDPTTYGGPGDHTAFGHR